MPFSGSTEHADCRRSPERSSNPYGFIKLTVPTGDSMIANPLNTRANTLNGLMPDVPDGTEFYKWNEAQQNYDGSGFVAGWGGGWDPDLSLFPGEGGIIKNFSGQPFVVTFIGEVLQGHLARPIPAGNSIRSSMVPQAGGITTLLGYGPEDGLAAGDNLLRYVNSSASYVTYTYQGASGWYRTVPPPSTPLEPQPAIGESFWLNSLGPRTWKRTFWVWP